MPLRRAVLAAGALIALPVATHFGAVYRQPLVALAGIALFLLPALWESLRRGRYLGIAAALSTIAMLWLLFGALSLLYAVPVAVNLSLFTLFAGTLLPGRKPLITAYVELQYDTVSPEMCRYTGRVTAAWSVFFALMAVQCVLLALLAPVQIWSLFVNFLNYMFVAAFFAVEYLIRRRVLRNRRHPSFARFLRNVLRTDFRQLLKQST